MTIPDTERRKILVRSILRELTEYFGQHKGGLPIKALSAKFGKSAQYIGGFQELIASMQSEGLIRVEYSKQGARTVWAETELKAKPPEKVWF